MPVSNLDEKDKIITKLLSYALERVKINLVTIDRGFFDSKSIAAINKFHLRWLMPAQKNFSVKRVFDLTPAPSVITGFAMKHVRFNLVILSNAKNKT